MKKTILIAALFILLPSCGSSGSKNCIDAHPENSGMIKTLSIQKCGDAKWHEISKSDLGNQKMQTGRFTGKMTGVGDLSLKDAAHVFFFTGIAKTGITQNLRITISGSNPKKPFLVRFITRYYTGSSFIASDTRGHMRFEAGKEYTFDCQWNSDYSKCHIYDSAKSQTLTLQVNLKAPYENLGAHLIRLGSGIVYGQKPGKNARSSGIRITLYEKGEEDTAG